MTTLLLWILLTIQIAEPAPRPDPPPPGPEEAVVSWMEVHNQQPTRGEPVWAILQYDRESPSWSQRVRSAMTSVPDSLWREWTLLESGSEAESDLLLKVAIQSESESQLLYLLLQVPEERRQEVYSAFYEQVETTRLRALNRSISLGEPVPKAVISTIEDPFAYFLLLNYGHRLPSQETSFVAWIADELAHPRMAQHASTDPLMRDMYDVARFRAAYELDRYGEISSLYPHLRELPWLPSTSLLRNLYRALDYSLYMSGEIDLSLEVQRRHTLPLTRTLAPESEPDVLSTHGGYLYTLGRIQDAEEVYLQLLDQYEEISPALRARVLNNLGLVYYKTGNHDRYIETQMRARDIALQEENLSYLVQIYRNLHIYYRKNRQLDAARQTIDQARTIASRLEDPRELILLTISAANFALDYSENPDEARELLDRARELLGGDSQDPLYVRMLTERAALYRMTGEATRAEPVLKEVLERGEETNNKRVVLNARLELARIAWIIGDTEQAQQELTSMESYNLRLLDFPDLVQLQRLRAELAIRNGTPEQAEEILRQIYSPILERAQHTSDPETGYWTIEPSYLDLFQLYADLLIDQGRLAEAAVRLDHLKTINDASLTEHPLLLSDRLSEEELAENRRIQHRMEQLRREWVHATGEEQFDIQNELTELAARRNQIDRVSRTTTSGIPEEISSLHELKSDEILIHQTRIRETLYQITFTQTGAEASKLQLTDEREEMIRNTLASLTDGRPDLNRLHDLYRWLGLDRLSPEIRRITLLPDSYFYQLPIDILPTEPPDHATSYGSSRYLIEASSIVYLNRLRDRFEPARPHRDQSLFSGFAVTDFRADGLSPLPEAVPEVETIAGLLKPHGDVHTYLNRDATHRTFLESASQSRILHLATHSVVSEQDPLYSHMMLWPDSSSTATVADEPLPLFAWQLFQIPFQNQLIMLNSCDTAGGNYLQGAGVMGFSRALRYAGAESLILNAWPVHDSTARDLATRFYGELMEGGGRANSLQYAKVSLIEEQANPYYWGAWILFGNPDPLMDSKPNFRVWSLLLLLLFGGGYALWVRLRIRQIVH